MLIKRVTAVLLVIGVLVLLARMSGAFDAPAQEGEGSQTAEPPLPSERDRTFDGVRY
jgi:hypothetical protein